jgi:hypothetical protein
MASLNKQQLEVDDWFRYVEKELAITVDTIRKIIPGNSECFLFIDRNFLDVLLPGVNDIEDKLFNHDKFYAGRYTKGNNSESLKGTFLFDGCLKGTVEEKFEFDVLVDLTQGKYKKLEEILTSEFGEGKVKSMWLPLVNDLVCEDVFPSWDSDEESSETSKTSKVESVHCSMLDGSTKIGWRGFCVKYEDVPKIPNLFIK